MSVLDEVSAASQGHPVPDISVHEKMVNLQTELERSKSSVQFWADRTTEAERKIDNVAGYLRDCIDMGDSPDADTIADYLDIDLQREFAVSIDVTFQFVIKAKNEDEAQEFADAIYFSTDGDYESDEYEVTSIDVNEV